VGLKVSRPKVGRSKVGRPKVSRKGKSAKVEEVSSAEEVRRRRSGFYGCV
jgi:hypothetical protein